MNADTDLKLNELLHQYVFITNPAEKVTADHNFLAGRESFDPIMAELARHRWAVHTTVKADRSVLVQLKHPNLHFRYEITLSGYHDHAHIRALAILALLSCGLSTATIKDVTGVVFGA